MKNDTRILRMFKVILLCTFGGLLSFAGVRADNWKAWALFVCVLLIDMFSGLIAAIEEENKWIDEQEPK